MRTPRPRDVLKYRRDLYTARDVSPVTIAYVESTTGRKVYRPAKPLKLPPGFTRPVPPLRGLKAVARMAAATGWDGKPADLIDPSLVPAVWEGVRRSAACGRPPPRETLAAFVRRWPIPDDLRELVAAIQAGEIKRPRGPDPRPAFLSFEDGGLGRGTWAYRVLRWKRAYTREKERTGKSMDPYRSALSQVSEESGIPEDTLDRWLYPR